MLTDEYKIKLVNGIRNMENAGESPENIQRFVNAFKVKYGNDNQTISHDTIEQTPEVNKTGFKSLVEATNKMVNPVETYKNPVANAKAMTGLGLQAAQVAGGYAMPGISGVTTTPLTEYAYQRLQGQSNREALKEAAIAGGIDVAMPFIGNIAGKTIGSSIKKGGDAVLKKTIPFFTGVSKESTERVINKPSILKSKTNNKEFYSNVGEKAEEGLNKILTDTGGKTSVSQQLLKGVNKEINPNDIINSINKDIDFITFDGVNALTKKDKESISELIKDLKPIKGEKINISRLEGIKQKAQAMVDYDKDISSKGNNILQGIASKVRETIHSNLPENLKKQYIESHKMFEDIKPIQKKVSKLLSDDTGGRLKSVVERSFKKDDVFVKNEQTLKELDSILPKKYKFYDKIQENIAKEEFTPFFPNNAALRALPVLTSGSIGYMTRNPRVIAAAGAIGALTSPRLAGKTIQAKAGLENALKVASTDKRVGAATRKLAIELSKAFRQEKE